MKKARWSLVALAVGALCLAGQPLFAEEHAEEHAEKQEDYSVPGYSIIHYDEVEPHRAFDYEANTKAWVDAFAEAGMDGEWSWRTYAGPNFTYAFVAEIPNYAHLDDNQERQKQMAAAIGSEKVAELVAGLAASSHYQELAKQAPELAYMPEGGMYDFSFVRLAKHYVKPGMEEGFKKLVMKVNEARRKTGSPMMVSASEVQFGHGTFQFAMLAKDAAAFYAEPDVGTLLVQAYGQEQAQALLKQWTECITDYKTSDWRFRPELSYLPDLTEPAEMKGSFE